jgi:hypothetical protein
MEVKELSLGLDQPTLKLVSRKLVVLVLEVLTKVFLLLLRVEVALHLIISSNPTCLAFELALETVHGLLVLVETSM